MSRAETEALARSHGLGVSVLPRVLALAVRELRAGFGVMVITAVGAMSDALRFGLERQGEQILGGDITLSRTHARATPAEIAVLRSKGLVSETAILRTMARSKDGSEQVLVELKAVDRSYPLAGELRLADGAPLFDAIGTPGTAAVDPILLERLGIKIGDSITGGRRELTVRGAIQDETE